MKHTLQSCIHINCVILLGKKPLKILPVNKSAELSIHLNLTLWCRVGNMHNAAHIPASRCSWDGNDWKCMHFVDVIHALNKLTNVKILKVNVQFHHNGDLLTPLFSLFYTPLLVTISFCERHGATVSSANTWTPGTPLLKQIPWYCSATGCGVSCFAIPDTPGQWLSRLSHTQWLPGTSLEKKSQCREGPKKNSRSQAACNTWHVQSINCYLFYTNSPPQHKTPVFKHPKQPLSAQNVLLSKPKPTWFLENGPYTQQNIKQMNSLTQVSNSVQHCSLFTAHQPSFSHSCCVYTHQ